MPESWRENQTPLPPLSPRAARGEPRSKERGIGSPLPPRLSFTPIVRIGNIVSLPFRRGLPLSRADRLEERFENFPLGKERIFIFFSLFLFWNYCWNASENWRDRRDDKYGGCSWGTRIGKFLDLDSFFWRRKEERSFRSKLWWNEFNKTGGVGKIGVMKYIYRKDWGVGRIPWWDIWKEKLKIEN